MNRVVRLLSVSLSDALALNATSSLPITLEVVLVPHAPLAARDVGVLGVSLYSVEMVMFLLPLSNCFQYRSLDSLPALRANAWLETGLAVSLDGAGDRPGDVLCVCRAAGGVAEREGLALDGAAAEAGLVVPGGRRADRSVVNSPDRFVSARRGPDIGVVHVGPRDGGASEGGVEIGRVKKRPGDAQAIATGEAAVPDLQFAAFLPVAGRGEAGVDLGPARCAAADVVGVRVEVDREDVLGPGQGTGGRGHDDGTPTDRQRDAGDVSAYPWRGRGGIGGLARTGADDLPAWARGGA